MEWTWLYQTLEIIVPILLWIIGIAIGLFILISIICYPAVFVKKLKLHEAERIIKDRRQIVDEALYLEHSPHLQKKLDETNKQLEDARKKLDSTLQKITEAERIIEDKKLDKVKVPKKTAVKKKDTASKETESTTQT